VPTALVHPSGFACCHHRRSLGQNFCTDDNILSDIVTAARVTPSDVVIEVGPGTGNLTRHLLATRARVLAVEKDDTLIERLREEFKQVKLLSACTQLSLCICICVAVGNSSG
jgi:16S rRNA A1518/A1519 N6-dimethyltransferase RsmA/KsgA/DIM1 with predicted DNA glycosylase/AP lyase activity